MTLLEEKIRKIIYEVLNERNYYGAGGGDDYYTRAEDANSILDILGEHLNGKIVYCPCDNPSESQIYKALKDRFNELGIRGIYATWMDKKACYFDGHKEHITPIKSGRFQDNEDYFKMCDVVVTNPPFSEKQPRQMLDIVMKHGKEYILIGPKALSQHQWSYAHMANGKMNALDYNINNFDSPSGKVKPAPSAIYTSFKRETPYYKTGVNYDPQIHRKFDDSDVVYCSDYRQIPDDYYGDIAVSANGGGFPKKLNRDQFDISDRLKTFKMDGKTVRDQMVIRRKPEQKSIYSEALSKMKKELGIE